MGRQTNTQQRRAQIVSALMNVIVRKGYSGASIQDIAREASLTPGLIHYHFESKQEILITLFERLEALVNQRMESGLQELGQGDPPAALDAVIDAFLRLDDSADQRAVRCWTIISAESVNNPELARVFRKVIYKQLRQLGKFVQLALGASARKKRIQAASATLLAAVHGSFLLAATAPRAIPAGSAAANVKLMARGLLKP